MCLGVPGRVTRWLQRDEPFASAEVEFGGIRREVAMDCAASAVVGDYVMVHAGVAISVLAADEAERLLDDLRRIGECDAVEDAATADPRQHREPRKP